MAKWCHIMIRLGNVAVGIKKEKVPGSLMATDPTLKKTYEKIYGMHR